MITNEQELETLLQQMVEAQHRIDAEKLACQRTKQNADTVFAERKADPERVIADGEKALADYYNRHADNFFPPKKKTLIVGSAKIFLRLTSPVLKLRKQDADPDPASIITAIESRIPYVRGTARTMLEACLEKSTKLVVSAVKKLDEETLAGLNLDVVQSEELKWSPVE